MPRTLPTQYDPLTQESSAPMPAEVLEAFGGLTATEWARLPVRSQLRLPPSTVHMVSQTLTHLSHLAHDPRQPPGGRALFWVMFLTAPRWLWSEPPKAVDTALPAHSRPRHIRERCQWVHDHRWQDILRAAEGPPVRTVPTSGPAATTPGLLTTDSCKRLLSAAKAGRMTSAWKQLWSYGLAPACPATVEKIQAKWLADGPPVDATFLPASPAQMADLLQDTVLNDSVRQLHTGSTLDVFGWTHEVVHQLWVTPGCRACTKELLTLYGTAECGTLVADMLNLSKVLPLNKDQHATQVRPLAVPTVLRKIYAKATVLRWKRAFALAAGPHQYGCMRSNGAAVCAREARCAAESRGDHTCFARTDITNAFNCIDRSHVLRSLALADPTIASCHLAWLRRPTWGLIADGSGQLVAIRASTGIPQGDPLSSIAFAVSLAPALAELTRTSEARPLAFADDVVLIAQTHTIQDALQQWRRLLLPLGLALNASKLAVWSLHHADTVRAQLLPAWPNVAVTQHGFTLCGLPVDHLDPLAADMPVAWGTQTYLDSFLEARRLDLTRRLTCLTSFIQTMGPNCGALHAATHILRINLLPRYVHLFRFLSLHVTLPWARLIDADIRGWVAHHFHCQLDSPALHAILSVPVAHAGLGLSVMHYEAPLHCLFDHLAITAAEASPATAREQAASELAAAEILRLSGLDVWECARHLLPHRRPAHVRQEFLERLRLRMLETNPFLTPPTLLPAAVKSGVTTRFQCRVLMSWFTASGPHLLPDAAFRYAFLQHCRLPLFRPDARCSYVIQTHGTVCNQLLGTYGAHLPACRFGPRQRRHNQLRDAWAGLARQAGWTVAVEQMLATGPDTHRQADLLLTSPSGLVYALDLVFSGPLADDSAPTAHLHRTAMGKAARYLTTPAGTLPGGIMLWPVAYSATRPWLESHGVLLLHRLLTDVAARTLTVGSPGWGPHFAGLTCRLTAHLSTRLALENWRIFSSCAGWGA